MSEPTPMRSNDNKQPVRCPEHPLTEPEIGFGLAGGGYGPYTLCPVCYRILNKWQEGDPDHG